MSELLSHEQTIRLIELAKSGDRAAEETLVIKNAALVKSIVKGFIGRGMEYDDLFQTGCIGLIKAIKGYDPAYEVRFSTYAVPMISGEIKRFLRDDGIIKVSRSYKENAVKIYRAQERLKRALGRDPTIGELSRECELSEEDITQSLDAVREPVSIYEPVYGADGDSKALLMDQIASDEGTEGRVIDKLMLERLMQELTERERKILLLRFYRDKTQSEIAGMMGVSQVQISRIISRSLEKLRMCADK